MPRVPTLLERATPWAAMEQALESARRGRGRLLSLEGEAGIGKTSLALAFVEAKRSETRTYLGGCEHLATPEPLGPLHDIARESRGRFVIAGGGPFAIFESLLRLLNGGRGPALLLLEDIHWADDSTLDFLRFLVRRIRTAPILAVVTFRSDEPASGTRLAALWADFPRDACERLLLAPLSMEGVATLATRAGQPAREIFDATGGNPFHVTEYLAAGGSGVPLSVRDSTLARAGGLSAAARHVLDYASIFPRRIDEEALRSLSSDTNDAGVRECLLHGMLAVDRDALAFRHELARRAVEAALPPLRRRELHRAALNLLKSRSHTSAAQLAHHAERAREIEDLVRFSVAAAAQAAEVGAQRQAVAHLARAIENGTWLTDADRADLLEKQAEAGELSGMFDIALAAIDEAIALRRRAADNLALGNALRIAARLHWFVGETMPSEAAAQEALELLRAWPETWQHAQMLSGQSQIDMLIGRPKAAIEHGEAAMAIADRLGRSDIYLHALTNVITVRCRPDAERGLREFDEAIAEARRRQGLDFLPRLYSNRLYVMAYERIHDGFFECVQEGLRAAAARDNAPLETYMRGSRALVLLDNGRLQEALAEAEAALQVGQLRGTPLFTAQIVLSRARVRLGLPEGGVLDEARAIPAAKTDVTRMTPIAIADAEAEWLGLKRAGVREQLRASLAAGASDQRPVNLYSARWTFAEPALWLTILGERVSFEDERAEGLPHAHRCHITGDWAAAAQAWQALGCPYEQAIALSHCGEAGQRDALAIFDRIGAAPAARNLRRAMRASGIRSIPVGPRSARRNDAAGLTPRQREVLTLLATGSSNAEIGKQLGLSEKTVEHHVGAVLAALDAPSRFRAAQIARERGLLAERDA
jgi:DNA-binding CsgD family transcriptional regulator/tetratricopeptide (TPR) repeat protein